MDYLIVDGVKPYDGRYEFDLSGQAFSVREWGWVKRYSGYLPLTFDEGLLGSDAELMAVFALIALVRSGKVDRGDVPQVWERFADAPGVVTIRLELAPRKEDAADPLAPERSSGNDSSSGNGSAASSESSATLPPVTGTPASATSGSHPARPWAT